MVHLRSVWLRDLKFDSHLNLKYPRLKSLTYLKDKESKKGRVFIKMILLWKASLINVSGKAKGVLHKSNKTVKYAHQIGRKKYNQLSPFCSNKRQSFNLSLAAAKCQFQLTALRQQCVSYLSLSLPRSTVIDANEVKPERGKRWWRRRRLPRDKVISGLMTFDTLGGGVRGC